MPISTISLFVLSLLVAAALQPVAATEGFLAGSADVVSRDRIVDQFRSLLGHGQNRGRLAAVEELMRPTFLALPKDSRGSLEHRAARYALYRYFLVEHGWHINGLSRDVDENSTSSPAEILKSRMPSFILEVLQEQMGSDRVGLDELAVLAATIEDLVHGDAVDLLELAYKIHGLSTDETLDADQADLVIRTFTLYFVVPALQEYELNASDIISLDVQDIWSRWEDTMLWVEDVKHGLEYQDGSSLRPFVAAAGRRLDFGSLVHWATTISAGFGQLHDLECKGMKNKMLDLEDIEREDGRVSLARFYAQRFAGNGTDTDLESSAWLRNLGALDERNPQRQSVIVPNVMYSGSDCLASSGFHAVCCIDHCEVLMAGLEEQLSQPSASPALVAAVVSAMPSDTVAAPRNLSAPLRSRLDEIAGRHGGSVPLHSRLFAQWMHYAFPNECPYPRSLLTSEAQLTDSELEFKHDTSVFATQEEMVAAVALANGHEGTVDNDGHELLWSEDEELLSDLVVEAGRGFVSSVLCWLAAAAALVASASALREAAFGGRSSSLEKGRKHARQQWIGRVSDLSLATESRDHFV